MSLRLYNTLTRKMEEVLPEDRKDKIVTMYNCGPTVYSRQHIGNYRAFTEWDILHRALNYLGVEVKRITNITDVGHMSADEDFGDDKMEKSAEKTGKQPVDIADEIILTFFEDLMALNIRHPNGKEIEKNDFNPKDVRKFGWTRATDYIQQMIDIIKKMEESGFTYETEQAVYFDVTKYPEYTKLSGQSLSEKEVGVREDVNVDPNKKNPADFVLWMKLYGKYKTHIMQWDSPWGVGFPGWHIECSAMGSSELGEYIDIHTGGVEHIGVHHSNERAQNFGAFKHEVVRMWVHNAWLVGKTGQKMAKSEGKVYTIPELIDLGYEPLDFRYYVLTVKYRKPLYFSLGGLDSARSARASLLNKVSEVYEKVSNKERFIPDLNNILKDFNENFINALENDLNTSESLAVLNEMLTSDNSPVMILNTVASFDKVLALDLVKSVSGSVSVASTDVDKLLKQRQLARDKKDFAASDKIREKIEKLGYMLKDTPEGQQISKDFSK